MMNRLMNLAGMLFSAVLLGGAVTGGAYAADYPAKPIRLVVPFPAGGPADNLARPLAQKLTERLGQTVVVENRPGANTMIGAQFVAGAEPDGYTLLLASDAGMSLVPAYSSVSGVVVPYDPATDFAPISMLAHLTQVLSVHPDVPVKTLQELIALAKKQPGKLSYASFGVGSQSQIAMETLNLKAGIDILHVPYKGASPALTDLVAGRVNVMLSSPSGQLPYIRDGRLRALAYAGPKRSPALPDVPTFAELGMPDYESRGWFGVVAPSGTPQAIQDLLRKEVWSIVGSPDYQNMAILANGFEVSDISPDKFPAFLAEDRSKWKALVDFVKPRL